MKTLAAIAVIMVVLASFCAGYHVGSSQGRILTPRPKHQTYYNLDSIFNYLGAKPEFSVYVVTTNPNVFFQFRQPDPRLVGFKEAK